MPKELYVTRWNSNQRPIEGYWGEVTATLDWCERNYELSRYVAEMWNTMSNLAFISLALYGIYHARNEVLPLRHAFAIAGIAIVGVGSFLFHGSLLYEYQLLDEIPMLFSASIIVWILFDLSHETTKRTILLPVCLVTFNVAVVFIYLIWPEPVFHQASYALIQSTTVFRTIYLLRNKLNGSNLERRVRKEAQRLEITGAIIFAFGFFVWNIDNQFCTRLDNLRQSLPPVVRPLLELHAWWHICTGYGAYLMVVGISRLTLALSDPQGPVAGCAKWQIVYRVDGIVPYVTRTELGWRDFTGRDVSKEAAALAKTD